MVFNVSYDLKVPGKDYKSLIDELKRSTIWWHYLESTWLISTSESADQLANRLFAHMDQSDRLLVMPVRQPARGWMEQEAWDWINKNVSW